LADLDWIGPAVQAAAAVGGVVMQGTAQGQSKEIARKNLQFQKKQYHYQKNLNKKIFAREDNAVQRRVADLEAAGINPLLAAGQGARAGSPVATNAPQESMAPAEMAHETGMSMAQQALTLAQARKLEKETEQIGIQNDISSTQYSFLAKQLQAGLDAVYLDNKLKRGVLEDRIEQAKQLTAKQEAELAKLNIDVQWQKQFAAWLRSSGNKTGALTPGQMNYMAMAAAHDLNRKKIGQYRADQMIRMMGRWGILSMKWGELREELGLEGIFEGKPSARRWNNRDFRRLENNSRRGGVPRGDEVF
jgi:hypothetical protein